MTKRNALITVVGALIVGGFSYVAVWPFVVGERNMKAFCGSLEAASPIAQVRDLVLRNQYRMTPPDKAGRSLIHDSRAFGRFICEVQFNEERLVSAQYQRND